MGAVGDRVAGEQDADSLGHRLDVDEPPGRWFEVPGPRRLAAERARPGHQSHRARTLSARWRAVDRVAPPTIGGPPSTTSPDPTLVGIARFASGSRRRYAVNGAGPWWRRGTR